MSLRILLIIFFWAIQPDLFCQSYHSDFEKSALNAIQNNNEASVIRGLLAIDPQMNEKRYADIQKTIDEFYLTLDPEKLKSKPLKQVAKKVFISVHDRFFKKYELVAGFNEIFSDGIYNCVSATALYGIIF